jgi:N-acetylglucosamine-6-sulfatase
MKVPGFAGKLGRTWAAAAVIANAACGGGGTPTTPGSPGPPTQQPTPAPTPTPAWRPNIVLILADDLDVLSIDRMPNLSSQVAGQGLTFSNGFATTPLCCPSRASILTGQYAHNHGILINRNPNTFGREPNCFELFRDRGQERQTFATWMQAAGYVTGFVGKYLNRYPGDLPGANPAYVSPGWDDWFAQVSDNRYYNYDTNENGVLRHYGGGPADYLTDVLRDRAVQFIRDAASPDRPFLLWINPAAPHTPATPAPRHAGIFAEAVAPRLPNFNEDDMSDKPGWFRLIPQFTADEIARLDGTHRQRLRTMSSVDDMIGSLIEVLRETGTLDRTFFIFASDNGLLLGAHRMYLGKDALYENSIRTPLIVRGPGVPAGRTLDYFALNIDLAPTLVEMARAQAPPDFMDGRSLYPLLGTNPLPAANWRSDFLLEHWTDIPEGLPTWRAIRARDRIYGEYEASGEREYYDLQRDPHQLQNQAASTPSSTLQPLQARLSALRNCRGAGCR